MESKDETYGRCPSNGIESNPTTHGDEFFRESINKLAPRNKNDKSLRQILTAFAAKIFALIWLNIQWLIDFEISQRRMVADDYILEDVVGIFED